MNVRHTSLPSRTAILVAAARAFGSRDPDPGVRNPDFLAERLIGEDELSLISDHPFSHSFKQEYAEASQNPAIVMFAGLMILRTRFIDQALKRAVENGASQVVILGAGFDSRAYRFRDLLTNCRVFEVDAEATQSTRSTASRLCWARCPNVTYLAVDFSKQQLSAALKLKGFDENAKSFYISEGVSMYLPENRVRELLRVVRDERSDVHSVLRPLLSAVVDAKNFNHLSGHAIYGDIG